MKTVLVTGAEGFIGHNLCIRLAQSSKLKVLKFDVLNTAEDLAAFVKDSDFVIHLAGVMRPVNLEAHKTENADFTSRLLALLCATGRRVPVLLTSSTQAAFDNPYGESKRLAEDAVFAYGKDAAADVYVYRLTNAFGKWCRPNYNSAVATWCHNIANGLPIQVRDPDAPLTLVYVDDIVTEFMSALENKANRLSSGYCEVPVSHTRTLGQITETLYKFTSSRVDRQIPNQSDGFTKKLYATYLSYLPLDSFSYPLKMNADDRGSFTEFLKTPDRGQVSVNISKPGITKGNHWHHTKVEKFLVVSGRGVIRFRKVGGNSGNDIVEYCVSSDKLEVVDIPPGYTHNIENLGQSDMVTVMWANEAFDPERPDTIFEKV